MDNLWWKEAVGYQIYIKSFCDSNNDGIGDINGITSKLEYIKELGVDFIWVCPFYKSPMDDNGYDISDYRQIHSTYGNIEDVEEMIKKAHKLGLKVMFDLVLNHTSDEHEWFIKSRDRKSGYEDFYYWHDGKKDVNGKLVEPNNWQSFFGGSAWNFDKKRNQYYMKIFSNKMPDINFESDKAREELKKVISWWASKGIDGFRVDAISHVGKDEFLRDGKIGKTYKRFSNQPSAHKYIKEFANTWKKYGIITMGELGGDPTEKDKLLYTDENRRELDMIFSFEHLKHSKYKNNKKVIDYKKIFKGIELKEKLINRGGWSVLFWTNHDYARVASMYGDEKYLVESCSALATAMYCLKGTVVIYNGEELGMTNYPFKEASEFDDVNAKTLLSLASAQEKKAVLKDLKNNSRDNARTIMQWNGNKNAGFSTKKTWFVVNPNYKDKNVELQISQDYSVIGEYKKILKLRKEYKDCLCYGSYKKVYAKNGVFAYLRKFKKEKILVITNFTRDYKKIKISNGDILYSNYSKHLQNTLKSYETLVIKLHK